jgi:hypothetical protein
MGFSYALKGIYLWLFNDAVSSSNDIAWLVNNELNKKVEETGRLVSDTILAYA